MTIYAINLKKLGKTEELELFHYVKHKKSQNVSIVAMLVNSV